MSIGVRLLLTFAVALLPVFAMEAYNSYSLYEARYTEVQKLALQQAEAAASDVNEIIETTRGLLSAVAQTSEIDAADLTKCATFLKSITRNSETLSSVSVTDNSGNILCSSIDGAQTVNVSDRQYFKEAMTSTQVVVGTYIVGRSDGRPALPIAVTGVKADGTKSGIVVGTIDLNWLSQHIIDRGYAQGGSVTIADRNGTILARQPLADQFVGKSVPDEFLHLLQDRVPGNFQAVSRDGSKRIYGYVPLSVPPAGLYVSTGLSTELSFAPLRQSYYRQIAAFLVLLCASAGIAFIANRFLITNPVNRILAVTQRWQQGDTSARTGMQSGTGEFGKIGEEFDRAATTLVAREKTINLLLGEIQHRAKNQIMLISAAARQMAKNEESVSAFAHALDQRLQSMARSQDLLLKTDNKPVHIETVVRTQLETFKLADSDRLILKGATIQVVPDVARNIGMAIHELLTNAQKHGALRTDNGRIEITWQLVGPEKLSMQWSEFHNQRMEEPRSTGFGRVMIERIIPQMLNGESSMTYNAPGLVWRITFPITSA